MIRAAALRFHGGLAKCIYDCGLKMTMGLLVWAAWLAIASFQSGLGIHGLALDAEPKFAKSTEQSFGAALFFGEQISRLMESQKAQAQKMQAWRSDGSALTRFKLSFLWTGLSQFLWALGSGATLLLWGFAIEKASVSLATLGMSGTGQQQRTPRGVKAARFFLSVIISALLLGSLAHALELLR